MKRLIFLLLPVLLVMLAFRPVRSHSVSGTVSDETGAPVAGASVLVKGTRNGTMTDANGQYKLNAPSGDAILVVSMVGYRTQEIKIKKRSLVNVKLVSDQTLTQEVVVVGYAQQKARKDMAVAPAPSYYLQGRVSGLMVNTTGYPEPDRKYPGMDQPREEFNREGYDKITENRFLKVTDNPLSTFSIDVDAASYSNIRRFINQGQLPPAGAVRIEEMVNYFNYSYPQPRADHPFSINTEISDAPWNKEHKLVLIGLQGKKIATENLPASNLVFLIDVSGSMQDPLKLPLVKSSMKLLVEQLRPQDRISMVVYAGAAGRVLEPTAGNQKEKIIAAIDRLEAGGSTAGGAGIRLAYKTAREFFMKGGNNRVILCTDGDFNVGESSDDAMERLIEEERKSGVFLTVLGYGMGNYQDAKMQKLADKGNGNHAYIDGISEAKKVLVNEFGGTLFAIAKDVKLQIEFNPARVQGYRLIGYENRMLAKEDFNDDKKDAGELGSGHTVTALYEVIPVGVNSSFLTSVDSLKYQKNNPSVWTKVTSTEEILTVKFRYKQPDGETSKLIEHPVLDQRLSLTETSENFRFAAAVAQFGLLLRNSEYKSASSFDNVLRLARKARGNDEQGYRAEFIRLVESAQLLSKGKSPEEPEEEVETGGRR